MASPGKDLLDYLGLRVRVALDEFPRAGGEVPLRPGVEIAIVRVGAEPIPEEQHPLDLTRPPREDVQVDVGPAPLEDAVLVPVRLADAQYVPEPFQGRDV